MNLRLAMARGAADKLTITAHFCDGAVRIDGVREPSQSG